MLYQDTIEKALDHEDGRIRCAAVGACKSNPFLRDDFVDDLRQSRLPYKRQAAMLACVNDSYKPLDWIIDGLNDDDYSVKEAAILAMECQKYADLWFTTKCLSSDIWYWRRAGVSACMSKDIPAMYISGWMEKYSSDKLEQYAAAAAAGCLDNHKIPDELAETVLYEAKSPYAKKIAAAAIAGRYLPSGKVISMLHHPDSRIRCAGLYACMTNHSVPYTEKADMLLSDDVHVRRLASRICGKTRPSLVRVINPKGHVFKKCVGGVIIVADIPEDAQIRGNERYGYRADKATVVDVLGDFCGESVGVSLYRHDVSYRLGAQIRIDDFDFSYETLTTGFHFFTDYNQAKAF